MVKAKVRVALENLRHEELVNLLVELYKYADSSNSGNYNHTGAEANFRAGQNLVKDTVTYIIEETIAPKENT